MNFWYVTYYALVLFFVLRSSCYFVLLSFLLCLIFLECVESILSTKPTVQTFECYMEQEDALLQDHIAETLRDAAGKGNVGSATAEVF